jgi:bifunctional non-homologous end joining protein LigD
MPKAKDQLVEYRRRRDFSRTDEPAGRTRETRAARLEFVIQKHAASHLHYDLRLELDGVMKSWAVPKGPSLDPATKRLAMQVEDHPMEYNTFEGTIPKGEYGGGTVMLWDRGTYAPDEVKPGEKAAAAVRRGLRAGKLRFTFHGSRLHGSWALVRTDGGPKPKWLFFKHTDEHADREADITADAVTSIATGRTMEEIAGESERVWRSNRGGRAGGEERRARAAAAGSSDIAPMKPKPAAEPPADGGWSFEPWWGGTRVIAYATPDAVRISDGRNDVTRRHRRIADELLSLAARAKRSFVAEAELLDDAMILTDLLLDDGSVLLGEPWSRRKELLDALLRRRRLQLLRRQTTGRAADAMLRRAARDGLPGIIARRDDATYRPGASSPSLLRIPLR